MKRRRYLTVTAAAIATAAGCTSDDDLTTEPSEPTEDNDANQPDTTTSTRTSTKTAEPADATEATTDPTTDPTTEKPTTERVTTAEPTQNEPDRQSFSGTGTRTAGPFPIEGGFTAFSLQHDGSSNFIVKLVPGSGGREYYLANEIGAWQGVNAESIPAGDYYLDVAADGAWQIAVEQPRPTQGDISDAAGEFSDTYPTYLGPFEFEGVTKVTGRYSGDSNFIVKLLSIDGGLAELLFNEIGQFEGQALINQEGYGWIEVEATGSWTIQLEQG